MRQNSYGAGGLWRIIDIPVISAVDFFNNIAISFFLNLIPVKMQLQTIQNSIYEIRGQKIMFDFDLALLYSTETRILKQAVKRGDI